MSTTQEGKIKEKEKHTCTVCNTSHYILTSLQALRTFTLVTSRDTSTKKLVSPLIIWYPKRDTRSKFLVTIISWIISFFDRTGDSLKKSQRQATFDKQTNSLIANVQKKNRRVKQWNINFNPGSENKR